MALDHKHTLIVCFMAFPLLVDANVLCFAVFVVANLQSIIVREPTSLVASCMSLEAALAWIVCPKMKQNVYVINRPQSQGWWWW